MDPVSILIVVGIFAVFGSLAALVALSPEPPPKEQDAGLAADILCPENRAIARVRLGANGRVRILDCDRFPAGNFTCRKECLREVA